MIPGICGGIQRMWQNDDYLRGAPGVAEEGTEDKGVEMWS